MLGAFSISPDLASAMRSPLLLTSLFFLGVAESFAGCEGTMMGATSEDPLLSSVDLTFSPIYSSATTSGTSNCPNWDIALQERFARWQFLVAPKHNAFVQCPCSGVLRDFAKNVIVIYRAWRYTRKLALHG